MGRPASSAAIKFSQLAAEAGEEFSVCLVEKGSEIGAHILSGAVFETTALDELFPDWSNSGAPVKNPVSSDEVFYLIDRKQGLKVPSFFLPPRLHNPSSSHALSLANLCRWMAEKAEELGVMIFPGFAASEVLYSDQGSIVGVATGDMGVGQDGEKNQPSNPGMSFGLSTPYSPKDAGGTSGKQLIKI